MKGEIYRTDFSLDRRLSRVGPPSPPSPPLPSPRPIAADASEFSCSSRERVVNPERFMAMRDYIGKSVTFADDLWFADERCDYLKGLSYINIDSSDDVI
jgi:hypothetical protein